MFRYIKKLIGTAKSLKMLQQNPAGSNPVSFSHGKDIIFHVEEEEVGKEFKFCKCGKSDKYPKCDRSHLQIYDLHETTKKPFVYVPERPGVKIICMQHGQVRDLDERLWFYVENCKNCDYSFKTKVAFTLSFLLVCFFFIMYFFYYAPKEIIEEYYSQRRKKIRDELEYILILQSEKQPPKIQKLVIRIIFSLAKGKTEEAKKEATHFLNTDKKNRLSNFLYAYVFMKEKPFLSLKYFQNVEKEIGEKTKNFQDLIFRAYCWYFMALCRVNSKKMFETKTQRKKQLHYARIELQNAFILNPVEDEKNFLLMDVLLLDGQILFEKKEYEKAYETFRKIGNTNNDLSIAWRAICKHRMGKYDEAAKEICTTKFVNRLLRAKNSPLINIYNELVAYFLISNGDMKKAAKFLKKQIEVNEERGKTKQDNENDLVFLFNQNIQSGDRREEIKYLAKSILQKIDLRKF